ncbi:hypothetical protein DFH09DRAFT_1327664 [Mycena vulgaris]|nr:hypothetical protein DFH09DRAFT_1327664 [Mycena vulgaris]
MPHLCPSSHVFLAQQPLLPPRGHVPPCAVPRRARQHPRLDFGPEPHSREHEGQFDRNGRDFSGSAALYGLNGTTLVARLRRSDGSHHDASIDLNSVVCNRDGRLEKA